MKDIDIRKEIKNECREVAGILKNGWLCFDAEKTLMWYSDLPCINNTGKRWAMQSGRKFKVNIKECYSVKKPKINGKDWKLSLCCIRHNMVFMFDL